MIGSVCMRCTASHFLYQLFNDVFTLPTPISSHKQCTRFEIFRWKSDRDSKPLAIISSISWRLRQFQHVSSSFQNTHTHSLANCIIYLFIFRLIVSYVPQNGCTSWLTIQINRNKDTRIKMIILQSIAERHVLCHHYQILHYERHKINLALLDL